MHAHQPYSMVSTTSALVEELYSISMYAVANPERKTTFFMNRSNFDETSKATQFAERIFSRGNVIKVFLEEILWRKWKY